MSTCADRYENHRTNAAPQLNKSLLTSLTPPTSSYWIVGEHPVSDITHLYRATTQLKHTAESSKKMRVAPGGRKNILVNDSWVFQPSDYRLTRLETPFAWLRNTTAKRAALTQHDAENSHTPGVFFSRLRVLDIAKVMLASGNVFHTPDGLHEICAGPFWLAGAAMYDTRSHPQLARMSGSIASLAFALMQQQFSLPGYHDEFSFHPDAGCDVMGLSTAVNAMLIDIVTGNM
ncbi:unnamed protein product [Bodo saltans]|uniref:Uncharacterized protein n=1 Tax=Bodo saltans TaxID=75058 RepID=A0A0S4KN19_BODSA|nr:unnamed protein product [Bodo saltans]|eukprot:CUI14275.1 unnamed protein product [Bodo saltans]